MSLLSDLNNKIKRLSTRVAEEFKLHQLAINARVATVNGIGPDENGNVEIQTGASLPLGWEYTRLVSDSAPKGGVDYLGQEGTREFYADLWNYVNTEHPDRVISEDDWQAMYAAQNGNVPYYSTGDGSTTFRFPRVVSYLRAGETAGQYTAEGLPDVSHTHTRGTMDITGTISSTSSAGPLRMSSNGASASGAFSATVGSESYAGWSSFSGSHWNSLNFTASRSWTGQTSAASLSDSNPIYGNSAHVTPETITVVMGVIAFGEIRLLGTVTEEGILAEMQTYVKKSGDTMTGALSSDVDYFINVVRAEGNTYAATAERTDSGNKVLFGIGYGGINRGIYDNATNNWLVYYDANGYLSTGSARLNFGNGTQIWIA